ncbi:MAG: hypothetical protein ABS84_11195 [Rubrivivax sp. SCN 71-131]|nr:MAG: hypothetical protein ABS84_11195 [Rubrivivax sp. SCN 71-131]
MALGAVFMGFAGLSAPALPGKVDAPTVSTRSCRMDAIRQSVCIYQAILADVDKHYTMRGGGGIGRIVQNSTSSYSVHLLQEGREDVRTYDVRLAPDGKVTITAVTESTVRH